MCYLYQLGKMTCESSRDLTPEDYQKKKRKDTTVPYGTDCISKLLDWVVTSKEEPGGYEMSLLSLF